MQNTTQERTRRLALSAIFCALAFLVTLLPAPRVLFLSFDVKDTVIATAGLLLGPAAALSLSVAVPLLEFITVGATGFWGLLMDIVSTMAFSLTASLIYKYRKTLLGAVLSLSAAALLQVAAMMLANLFITPIYMKVSQAEVVALILPLLLPFNAVKSVFNASLVMLLYKPLSEALRRVGMLRRGSSEGYRLDGRSLAVLLLSLALVTGAALVLFLALGASYGG